MNRQYEMVKVFHEAIGLEMPSKATILSNGDHQDTLDGFADDLNILVSRMKFVSSNGFGGQVLKRSAYMLEEIAEFMKAKTIEDQVDALCDNQYFNLGTFTLMGVEPEKPFDIVGNANLGKILPDGSVLRDPETGKIMKPPGWEENFAPEPLLRLELERQSNPTKSFLGGD
ncbi:hypothetical protein ACFPES_02970 [Paenibacillus sp. GCM10023248]|uniref:hypothetical protein n=1 Tax=unclassified Paenibacillus TaxID=185978 RepID=UPI0023792FB7|nr:hypothetical protein [Paenibacillus sp. MAHUQ-63]MDD9265987.1 hypothetical protein [Paenibacillus sp. MAHUQ-63]